MQLLKLSMKRHQSNLGFTLIELLVVLVILGLLAGMVGPNVMKYIGSSKVEVAKAQLEDLSAGLDLFKLDVGRYPSDDEGLQVLVEGGDSGGPAYVYHQDQYWLAAITSRAVRGAACGPGGVYTLTTGEVAEWVEETLRMRDGERILAEELR